MYILLYHAVRARVYLCATSHTHTCDCLSARRFKTRGDTTTCTAWLQPVSSIKAGCIAQCVAVVRFPTRCVCCGAMLLSWRNLILNHTRATRMVRGCRKCSSRWSFCRVSSFCPLPPKHMLAYCIIAAWTRHLGVTGLCAGFTLETHVCDARMRRTSVTRRHPRCNC